MALEYIEDFGWILKDTWKEGYCYKCRKKLKIPFYMCEWVFVFVGGDLKQITAFYCRDCNLDLPITELCNIHNRPKSLVGKEQEEHTHTCIRKYVQEEVRENK